MLLFIYILSVLVLGASPVAFAEPTPGADLSYSAAGHLKYRLLHTRYPEDSVFRELLGAASDEHAFEARASLGLDRGPWDLRADYQFIALRADRLLLVDALPPGALPAGVIDDDRRWWDLTWRAGDGDQAVVNRLDRLSVGFTSERSAWRFGRQAISWGNGLIFTPMDVFNPFDPAAVDKEYKTGDDMLYGQVLLPGGGDLQSVAIVRRDPVTGEVASDQSSLAVKVHGFVGTDEFDLLAARHYGDDLLGLGGNVALGGAVLRGDLTRTRTDRETVWSAVASLSRSWTWAGKNLSGVAEYYYNGFGQTDGAYAPSDLAANPDLLQRLARGELFTLARQYFAASVTIEANPLLLLTPNVFVNLEDPSALAQLVLQYDIAQDLLLQAALNLPIGPSGSEYGGIESETPERYLSSGPGLFAQLAWYF